MKDEEHEELVEILRKNLPMILAISTLHLARHIPVHHEYRKEEKA